MASWSLLKPVDPHAKFLVKLPGWCFTAETVAYNRRRWKVYGGNRGRRIVPVPQARWIGSCRDSSQRRTWAFSAHPHRTKTEPDGSGALVERYDRQLLVLAPSDCWDRSPRDACTGGWRSSDDTSPGHDQRVGHGRIVSRKHFILLAPILYFPRESEVSPHRALVTIPLGGP